MRSWSLLLPLLAMNANARPYSEASKELDKTGFLAKITEYFPANTTLYTNSTGMMETWDILAKEFSIDTEANALNESKCADITVIFAKGTYDIGNIGVLTGPWFLEALKEKAGKRTVAMQGVEYAANMTGYLLGGDSDGSIQMAFDVAAAAVKCPKTKITMSGFSQGALLAHNAANMLPKAILDRVSSAVTFGDPRNPNALNGLDDRTLIICIPGDNVCYGGDGMQTYHLSYSERADEAATYVLSKAGLQY